jgi:hypothetical protein
MRAPSADTATYAPGEDAATIEHRAFMKAAWRLVPFVTVGYLLNYMDRNNVGFAALTMNRATGLTATQFGFGAGVLFFGYSAFEIPSNIALYRFGARRWIARIMITWGLVSAATAYVQGPQSWYVLRLLLGVAEAGFFPGITFYLATHGCSPGFLWRFPHPPSSAGLYPDSSCKWTASPDSQAGSGCSSSRASLPHCWALLPSAYCPTVLRMRRFSRTRSAASCAHGLTASAGSAKRGTSSRRSKTRAS